MDNNKKKNILLAILIIGIVTMTVAFAALSTTLTIKSGATIKGGSWEVLFVSGTGASAPTSAPASGRSAYFNGTPSLSATIIQNINAVLTQPGDTLTYNFKIRNNGTIDAKLDIISAVTPTCTPSGDAATTVCNNISRTLKYVSTATKVSDGSAGSSTMTANSAVAVDDVLKAGEEISVDLTISYTAGTTTESFPATDVTVTYPDQVLTYIQDDGQTHGMGHNPIDDHDPVLNNYGYIGQGSSTDTENGWATVLNSNWTVYLRKNTSTNVIDACGVFPNGTTCLTNNEDGYYSDFEGVSNTTLNITTADGLEATGLKGYSLTKAKEMLSKGASSCEVDNFYLYCRMPSGGICQIPDNGEVYCHDGTYSCNVYNEGYASCY